jgi:hypothetical protein
MADTVSIMTDYPIIETEDTENPIITCKIEGTPGVAPSSINTWTCESCGAKLIYVDADYREVCPVCEEATGYTIPEE